ncbi:MAG: iron ABC transporter permease [Kiritimatiellae bacterium]|nr:iron ABC transporter permease [Kiritimatiellia bacterium]
MSTRGKRRRLSPARRSGTIGAVKNRWTPLFLAVCAILSVLFLLPIFLVVKGGFWDDGGFTLRHLLSVFRNPVYSEGLFNSVCIATGTTSLCLLVSLPLAWISHKYEFPGKAFFSAIVLVPMILPPFVGAIGMQQILGRYGVLNAVFGTSVDWLGQARYFGVVAIQALALYPIVYLNATAALANVDPAMDEAAANLGCPGWKRFFRVTLPLIAPGLFAGCTIVFIWSFTELGAPLMLGYSTCASVQVFDALKEIGASHFPYALVFVVLSVSVLLYAAGKLAFGRNSFAMQGKAAVTFKPVRLRGIGAVPAVLPFALVSFVALLPHFGVVLTSLSKPGSWYGTVLPEVFTLGNYAEALGHDMTVASIRNSLLFSSVAVCVNLVLGVGVAFLVVRSKIRGAGILDALSMIPLAVPGLVMAFGYLAISSWLSNLGWVRTSAFWTGVFDVRVNPALFLVIAYAVRRLPYMVRSAAAGLQQTSEAFEEAAWNLGATPARTVRRVTLPLIAANLVAGLLLAFAFSMLEVSDSLMLAQQARFYPITKTIYELFQLLGTGKYVASALGVWAMMFLTATIAGVSVLLGKKMGALFRV